MILVDILTLIRIKDWLKNIIIFFPLIFSGYLFDSSKYLILVIGFIVFALVSSFIYVLNDILDVNKDISHPLKKKSKPIANGKISIFSSLLILILLFIILSIILFFYPILLNGILLYLFVNLTYNFGIKNIPYFEFLLISLGYIIRIDTGSLLINVESSNLIIISVYCLANFFIILKRVGEINLNVQTTRHALKYYNLQQLRYLAVLSILILFLTLLTYIYWINYKLIFSILFIFIFLFQYYNLTIYTSKGERPISLIFSNLILLTTALLAFFTSFIIYFN